MISRFLGNCFSFFNTRRVSIAATHYDIKVEDAHIYMIPKQQHLHTLIWMHGLGDSPESFLSLFGEEELLFPVTTRIVLLKAPMRAVTINQGHVSNSWFDIMSMSFAGDITKTVNMEQVYDSASLINVIIAKELKLVEHSSIFLGGFSQGCAMALYCGLTANQRFGGIMGLSGFWFPNAQVSKEALDTPLYLSHGGNDFMIPAKLAEHSYKMIPNAKLNIVPHLDHGIDETQLEAMATCFHEWTHKSN